MQPMGQYVQVTYKYYAVFVRALAILKFATGGILEPIHAETQVCVTLWD